MAIRRATYAGLDGVAAKFLLGITPNLFPEMSGGTEATVSYDGRNMREHQFTGDGTLTIRRRGTAFYLLVAGGGGGGYSSQQGNRGGGGGAFIGRLELEPGTYAITIGQGGGGGGVSNNGGSAGTNSTFHTITCGGGQNAGASSGPGTGSGGGGSGGTRNNTGGNAGTWLSFQVGQVGSSASGDVQPPTVPANRGWGGGSAGGGTFGGASGSAGILVVRYEIR